MFNKKFLIKELKPFLKIYNKRPIRDNFSGMKVEHCFALYCFLKKIKPKYVIESGIWKGQTTWLIKNTLNNVKLYYNLCPMANYSNNEMKLSIERVF